MIKKYSLHIKLLSDTLIASAEGYGSIIDIDIVFDDLGFPYIPAKRVKGVLRESAYILSKMFKGANIEYDLHVGEIFGSVGNTEIDNNLSLPNFYVNDYGENRKYFEYLMDSNSTYSFSKNDIISYFTNIRMQTSIDEDLQKTKKHSLRTVRVINKGNEFENSFSLDEKYEDALSLICCAAKKIGSKRQRGFGEVEIFLTRESVEIMPFLLN